MWSWPIQPLATLTHAQIKHYFHLHFTKVWQNSPTILTPTFQTEIYFKQTSWTENFSLVELRKISGPKRDEVSKLAVGSDEPLGQLSMLVLQQHYLIFFMVLRFLHYEALNSQTNEMMGQLCTNWKGWVKKWFPIPKLFITVKMKLRKYLSVKCTFLMQEAASRYLIHIKNKMPWIMANTSS